MFRKKDKYLRKKSYLLQDYIVFGLFLGVVGTLVLKLNRKINPKDQSESEITKTKNPLQTALASFQKHYNVVSEYIRSEKK